MTAAGRFAVSRGVWEHRQLASREFTRREAWLWLVSEAAWRPREIRMRGRRIVLQRGQVAHSERFMAKAWGWSYARVQRFIRRLIAEGMTDAVTDAVPDAVGRVLSICNYEKFHFPN